MTLRPAEYQGTTEATDTAACLDIIKPERIKRNPTESSPGHRMWLRSAVRELYPHVTMWVHYPQTEGVSVSRAPSGPCNRPRQTATDFHRLQPLLRAVRRGPNFDGPFDLVGAT